MTEDPRVPEPSWFALHPFQAAAIQKAFLRLGRDTAAWSDVRSFPALAVLAGLDCVGLLILLREWTGSPPIRLADTRFCAAGLAAAALTIASRWFLGRIEREKPALWVRSLLAALSVLPLIALLTTASARNAPWAVSLVSALAVIAGNVNLLWGRRSAVDSAIERPNAASASNERLRQPSPGNELPDCTKNTLHDDAGMTGAAERAAAEWIERTTDSANGAVCRGRFVAHFAAGQSIAAVHIPFIPVFERVPEFSCEVVGQPSIRARTPAVYCYGARLELKRAGDLSNATRVEIRIQANAAAHRSRAA